MQEVLDLMTLEQFLSYLEDRTQQWLQRHWTHTMEEALKITKDFATMEIKLQKEWGAGRGRVHHLWQGRRGRN